MDVDVIIKTQWGHLLDPKALLYFIETLLESDPDWDEVTIYEETLAHILNICTMAIAADNAPFPGPGGPPGLN